jgi:hypothetical protein
VIDFSEKGNEGRWIGRQANSFSKKEGVVHGTKETIHAEDERDPQAEV